MHTSTKRLALYAVAFFSFLSRANRLLAFQTTYDEVGKSYFYPDNIYERDCGFANVCGGARACNNYWVPPCPRFVFSFEGDYIKFFHLPGFDYGTFSSNGPLSVPLNDPRPWDLGHDKVGGFMPSASFTFFLPPLHPCNDIDFFASRLTLFGSIFSKRKKSAFDQLETNSLTMPFVDGSGTSIAVPVGASTLSGILERDYHYLIAGADLREAVAVRTCGIPMYFEPFVRFQGSQFRQNFTLNFDYALTDYHLSEEVHSTYYDLGGGLAVDFPVGCRLSVVLEGKALASYIQADLRAEQNFSGTKRDHHVRKNRGGGKFGGRAGLYFQVKCFNIGAVASYEYWTFLSAVKNPRFVGDKAAHIVREHHMQFYTAGLEASLAW